MYAEEQKMFQNVAPHIPTLGQFGLWSRNLRTETAANNSEFESKFWLSGGGMQFI